MKYLVISRPRKPSGNIPSEEMKLNAIAESVRYSLTAGRLERAWSFPANGHALVINAETDYEVASEIRTNPLCRDGHNELIPIEDLLEPLQRCLKQDEKRPHEEALDNLFCRNLARWRIRQMNSTAK